MLQIESVQKAINFIENNLIEIDDINEVAEAMDVLYPDLLQSFSAVVGYSLSEYIRNRKLYEAAKDLISLKTRVIDVALKYGYDSAEGFSRAFHKFHGVQPSRIAQRQNRIKIFRPITITFILEGGFAEETYC